MRFLQSICIVAAGPAFGTVIWLLVFGILFFLMQGFELGFVSISPDFDEYMRNGFIIGVGSGSLVALGLLFSRDRSSFIDNVAVGLLFTEFGVVLVQIYLFSLFEAWKSVNTFAAIYNVIAYFVFISGFFLIPTVLLVVALTKVATLSAPTRS